MSSRAGDAPDVILADVKAHDLHPSAFMPLGAIVREFGWAQQGTLAWLAEWLNSDDPSVYFLLAEHDCKVLAQAEARAVSAAAIVKDV